MRERRETGDWHGNNRISAPGAHFRSLRARRSSFIGPVSKVTSSPSGADDGATVHSSLLRARSACSIVPNWISTIISGPDSLYVRSPLAVARTLATAWLACVRPVRSTLLAPLTTTTTTTMTTVLITRRRRTVVVPDAGQRRRLLRWQTSCTGKGATIRYQTALFLTRIRRFFLQQ